ncbi:CSL zinc finger-domain-containing protein [Aspergillus candidus]|uniref:Diphthamide biosynthesis protein 4 n=1 Tax=Aspergillus candidus TaxID=41067 RepID=A0A2I2FGV1_ASPCN|nr:CSL zinc finger-domain-containing protein [Aspergillus candidus]PLB39858.1 CSL zinc finger-domain-containing protein [Aspergillus candidus]
MTQTHTHYEILNLAFPTSSSPSSTTLTKQQLKTAYHKALLQHHPDKTSSTSSPSTPTSIPPSSTTTNPDRKHTIDAITTAYKTLSDPRQRAEYDTRLRLERNNAQTSGPGGGDAHFHTGLEVVDLEDLRYEETDTETVWYRGCRCGDERGFLVTEEDLEREVEGGEVVVGCRGCSLYLRVLFAVGE